MLHYLLANPEWCARHVYVYTACGIAMSSTIMMIATTEQVLHLVVSAGLNYKIYQQDSHGPMTSYYNGYTHPTNNNPSAFDSATAAAVGTGLTDLSKAGFGTNLQYSTGFAATAYGYFIPTVSGTWTFTIAGDDMLDVYVGDNPTEWTVYYFEGYKTFTKDLIQGKALNIK